jgi:hypothetical protein
LEQPAFLPENPVDHIVSMASVWADQQAIGLWMADFNGDGRADRLWQNHDGQAPADFGSHEAADAVWQDADAMPTAWLMDGFNLASDNEAGFNPAAGWQDIPQYYDLA